MDIAGKYRVTKELGEGGYGRVYLVEHVDLRVRYALKLLSRALSEDARFIERFKREAEILFRFSHPGSVQLRDFGRTDDGLYYMAMDYCDGEILNERLNREGRFSVDAALSLIEQVLAVLEAAHKAGIIHRDIKPDNIMLVNDEQGNMQVKILDFGIAKLKEQVLLDAKTIEGVSIGTPQYMSPEQVSGEAKLDHRADIYSSGILLYELLTGDVPFKGVTVVQTLLMHLTKQLEPINAEFGIPSFVEEIILKALKKDRNERFSEVSEFRAEVRKAQAEIARGLAGSTQHEEVINPSAEIAPVAKGIRILCLDDNEMILNILKHILEKEGYEVFTATDCSSIHGYLFSGGVQLLISDVQMPGLPGTKVCQMLKQSLQTLKIVLFSNLPERELEKLSAESRADGWISKNTKPDEWLEKINTLLKVN